MENIVLIGMPGCGKSTVGSLVAKALGRIFVETDEEIVRAEGRSIPEIFALEGEAYFRDAETAAIRGAAELENAVISTGGGAILRAENMDLLAQNGRIFFLDRSPEDIVKTALEGRPLIGDDKSRIFLLYTQRIEAYRKYAQETITAVTPGETVDVLLRCLQEREKL